MRVIFLDIDGVLNSFRFNASRTDRSSDIQGVLDPSFETTMGSIDPEAVARLARLVKKTRAQLVLSSTWRLRGNSPDEVLRILERIFQSFGFSLTFIGHTPDLSKRSHGSLLYQGVSRANEIRAWLRENHDPDFVVLDDELVDLEGSLVQTSSETGLQDEHVTKAIELLKGHKP